MTIFYIKIPCKALHWSRHKSKSNNYFEQLMQHDSFSCADFPGSKGFPTQRTRSASEFVWDRIVKRVTDGVGQWQTLSWQWVPRLILSRGPGNFVKKLANKTWKSKKSSGALATLLERWRRRARSTLSGEFVRECAEERNRGSIVETFAYSADNKVLVLLVYF